MLETNKEGVGKQVPIIRLWEILSAKFFNILNGSGEKNVCVVLPESVRYALCYRGAHFQPEDGVSLLGEEYGFLGIYICLKFFEENPADLRQHLQYIIQAIKENKSFDEYTKKLRSDVLALPRNSTVLGTKSAQVSRNGFSEFCEGISGVFNAYKKEGVPILVAFSGLLGLKGIVENMEPNEVFYIFFPKNCPEESFLRIKYVNNQIQISCLDSQEIGDIFHNENIVMIDDTQKTGATFDKAEKKIRQFCHPKNILKKALVVVQKNGN